VQSTGLQGGTRMAKANKGYKLTAKSHVTKALLLKHFVALTDTVSDLKKRIVILENAPKSKWTEDA